MSGGNGKGKQSSWRREDMGIWALVNRSKIVKQFGLKPSKVYVNITWNIVPNVNTLNFLLKDVNNSVTAVWLLYRWMRACPLEKTMGIHGDESHFRELLDQGERQSNRKGKRPTETEKEVKTIRVVFFCFRIARLRLIEQAQRCLPCKIHTNKISQSLSIGLALFFDKSCWIKHAAVFWPLRPPQFFKVRNFIKVEDAIKV